MIEKCEIAEETHTRQADGANRITGNKSSGSNIEVDTEGRFSRTISDFQISGKIGNVIV